MSVSWVKLHGLYLKYVKWVSSNPSALGDVEMTVKWLSYFIAGQINKSSAASELVYSLSNLLVFYNDRIIEKANGTIVCEGSGSVARQIKIILTTLEYCEVFIELSAHKVWGSRGRWFLIVVVQTIKCIGRLALTMFCRNNIVHNPPIPVLDRTNLIESRPTAENASFQSDGQTVVLKRSGKILRKVEGAPPIVARSWKPLKHESSSHVVQYAGRFIRTAELMYILKPMVHLACIRKYGLKSWKSYLVPMAMDVASLRIYYKNRQDLSKEQKQELSRRCVSMLLYLMRSPFYDKYSKDKIAGLLTRIGKNVPLTGMITSLILSYIPHWQETYFYMWSS
ncbi:peroxisomal membrane protein PEX16 [Topomyia yanbarensis]|uniref:peroxisomal membrane protein PEX16 n=1 Tax=Topomyia yanbarensis TaxID=2498891 RepID=UPI00273C6E3A|nr:peroxisomal membrane protein PEX16 [Topomyia yanbarensis]